MDVGECRIRLGALRLASGGTVLSFTAETNTPASDPAAWYGQHLNNSNRVVDFGDARTDGSAWLHREGDGWVLKTWPRERSFTLELSRHRFGQPAKVQCTCGAAAEVIPVQTGSRWRLPLNGAMEYRWTNNAARPPSSRSAAFRLQHQATLPEPPQGPRPAPFPTPLQPEGCAPMPQSAARG